MGSSDYDLNRNTEADRVAYMADLAQQKAGQLRVQYEISIRAARNATHLPQELRDARIAGFQRKLDALNAPGSH